MPRTATGAERLVQTAVQNGVEVCFTNPGTTEMPLVAALDTVPRLRAALGLFGGVVTGGGRRVRAHRPHAGSDAAAADGSAMYTNAALWFVEPLQRSLASDGPFPIEAVIG